MKKNLIIAILLLLVVGCESLEETTDSEILNENRLNVDNQTKENSEIEYLLGTIELELGLGNNEEATTVFYELTSLLDNETLTTRQQSRMNTVAQLLDNEIPTTEIVEDEKIFTGSDAAAKVMNKITTLPDGYKLVYHVFSSEVGSNDVGFYVLMVPVINDGPNNTLARETFFVTSNGEIMVLN